MMYAPRRPRPWDPPPYDESSAGTESYDVLHERELERIRHKTQQLRKEREDSSVFDSVDSLSQNNNFQYAPTLPASHKGREEQKALLRQFYASPEKPSSPATATSTSPPESPPNDDDEEDDEDDDDHYDPYQSQTSQASPEDLQTHTTVTTTPLLPLHDLCAEAVSVDDLAWRNALSLLVHAPDTTAYDATPQGWYALHIACMGPAPWFLIRGLLYANASAVAQPDQGGRKPLHLWCASPYCQLPVLQLLVEEYPAALMQPDEQGFLPLHLLLRNTTVECTNELVQAVLGWTLPEANLNSNNTNNNNSHQKVRLRRGQHLQLDLQTLNTWRREQDGGKPVTSFNRTQEMQTLPPDVKTALRQLAPLHDHDFRTDIQPTDLNPAAVLDPSQQLPLHQFVQRAIVLRQPLDTNNNNNPYQNTQAYDDNDDDDDAPQPSVPYIISVLRVLIAAHPAALTCRDALGHTPLSAVLSDSSEPPSLEVVEYLLGTKFQTSTRPRWANDLPNTTTQTPATMATPTQQQLPLHICAEEWTSHFPLLQAIHDAFPAAISQVDHRGRTPLHIALASYRRLPVPARTVELLYSDTVAATADDYGHLPLHALLQSPPDLPDDTNARIYQRLFAASNVHDLPSLSSLPFWLRRQACSSKQVQQLIVQAMAHPGMTLYCFLDGILLITLLVLFRRQWHEQFVATTTSFSNISSWYALAVYGTATMRLLLQFGLWILQGRIPWGQFWTVLNGTAMAVTLLTSVFLDGGNPDVLWIRQDNEDDHDLVLQLSALSTGLLWWALLGYLSTWWHGMAVFSGSCLHVLRTSLVWPLVAACALHVGAAQIFWTRTVCVSQTDEEEKVDSDLAICTAGESYRFVYLLMHGNVVWANDDADWSYEVIAMVVIFFLVAFVWFVSTALGILQASFRLDVDQVALQYFWEPQLNTVLSLHSLVGPSDDDDDKKKQIPQESGALERVWTILTSPAADEWYSSSKTKGRRIFMAIVSALVVPLWLLLGLLTLGLLWPSQVRRWMFEPTASGTNSTNDDHHHNNPMAQLRQELLQVKIMSYEKSIDTERELQLLRAQLAEMAGL